MGEKAAPDAKPGILQKLADIQQELVVPKSRWNDFSKFWFRNAETIEAEVKRIAYGHGCVLKLHDEVVQIGARYYTASVAELTDIETGSLVWSKAYAREDDAKKGMDGSQISGCASSYARKYALCGLFLIDDEEADPDGLQPETAKDASKGAKAPQRPSRGRFEVLANLNERAVGMGIKQEGISSWMDANVGPDRRVYSDEDIARCEEHIRQLIADKESLL